MDYLLFPRKNYADNATVLLRVCGEGEIALTDASVSQTRAHFPAPMSSVQRC